MSLTVKTFPDEPLRFFVESESEPGHDHVVDLENPIYPECSCTQWSAVCRPNRKKHQRPFGYSDKKNRTICKHGKAVLEYLYQLSN